MIPTPGFDGESLEPRSYRARNKFRVSISGLIDTPIRLCSYHAPGFRWCFHHNYGTIKTTPLAVVSGPI